MFSHPMGKRSGSPLLFARIVILLLLLSSCVRLAMGALHCGNCGQTPVPYPLSTGPNCGDQAYAVRCIGGKLWVDGLNGSAYMVTSIDPQNQRMIIRPPSFIPSTCLSTDLNSEGIHLVDALPLNITSSNTVLLLNCTDNMLHLQVPLNCSDSSICHNYISTVPAMAPCNLPDTRLCCSFTTGGSQSPRFVRVHEGGCLAYQSFVNLDPSLAVADWPAPGMELMWVTPKEPPCKSDVDWVQLPYSRCLAPDRANVSQKRCVCTTGRYWDPSSGYCERCRHEKNCKVRKKKMPTIGATLGAILQLILCGIVAYERRKLLKRRAKKILVKEREEILNAKSNGKSAKIFTGKEIKRATNNFSKDNLLGYGGFGEVFRGTLDDGTIAAVKRAKPGNMKGIVQLLNEVRILCQVNHRSLVRLLGCCVELEQPLLVYEYVPNGTLFDRLHGFRLHNWAPLNWLHRLIIAYQTADGLAYLHSSAIPPIYHRDVQSSNILVDERLDAKVTDFGLSRLVESNESEYTHINTSAQGTLGYLDPEYCINLQLTDRSDVYSFGVVLLELLTSKRVTDFNREEENVNLVVYVKKILGEDKPMDTIDPTLKEWASKVELETMQAVANLAAACLDERRENRPSMREVAEEIEYVIGILDANDSKAEQFTCPSPSQNSFLGLLWSFLVLCVL